MVLLYFVYCPSHAFVNDINQQLVNLYCQLKDNSSDIIEIVDELDSRPCDKEFYYSIREHYNQKISENSLDAECAALMIWVNKHCFNGLYRVNGKGLLMFLIIIKLAANPLMKATFASIAAYLQKSDVTISCLDFEDFAKMFKKNDFVYFDSPYIPESDTR